MTDIFSANIKYYPKNNKKKSTCKVKEILL